MKRTSIIVFLFLIFTLQTRAVEPPDTEQSKTLSSLVDKAATLVEKNGKDFFPELRKKDGDWWKGELYIFVDSMEGIVLVHPPDPKVEGQDLLKADPASKEVMQTLIDAAKAHDAGWVEYMWPKPGDTSPSKKLSYIRKVKMPDGALVIVGAGMYP